MINPNEDGITHINIYSQANTDLGRILSNFAKFYIKTDDGLFYSVEGYWYWLGIENCVEKENLRNLYGYSAKKYGNQLRETKNQIFDEHFQDKILNAIQYKVDRIHPLFLPQYKDLPFEHYYMFNGYVKDVKDKYLWMINGIDEMRKEVYKIIME